MNVAGVRQSGKTTWIIEYAAKNDAVILCANENSVEHLLARAESMGLKIKLPMTYSHYLKRGGLGVEDLKVVVDDAEYFIDLVIRQTNPTANLIGCTMTAARASRPDSNTQDLGLNPQKS